MSATGLLAASNLINKKKGGSSSMPGGFSLSNQAKSEANGSIAGAFTVGGDSKDNNYPLYIGLALLGVLIFVRGK